MWRRAAFYWQVALLAYCGWVAQCPGQLLFERTTVGVPANGTDKLEAEFPFTVGPAGQVVISKLEPDCSCTVGTREKEVYQPGETGRIKLQFQVGDLSGPQTKQLLVQASDQTQPHVLTLVTNLPRTLVITPKTVYWDHASPLTEKIISFEITDKQPSIVALRAASDNPAVSASVKELVPGRKFEIRLTPSDTTKVLVAKIDIQARYEDKSERAFLCFAMVKPLPAE